VCVLQRECGVTETLRVAPLFETLDDLHNSEASMESLLSNKWYCDQIGGRQECMIGYSDSGKDAGRLAAAWGLYEVQVMQALKPLGFKTFGLANILDLQTSWTCLPCPYLKGMLPDSAGGAWADC